LDASVNNLSKENRTFFEQLQIRQAELESSQHHAGTLQSQNTELQFQLREARDRVTLLAEEISDLRGEQDMRPQGPGVTQEEIISTMEAKYEAKLAEIKRNLVLVEKERTESEADWSRKLCEKSKETDELKMILQSSAKLREEKESTTGVLKGEIEKLTAEVQNHQRHASELQLQVDRMKDAEVWLAYYTPHCSL
jgi:predicted RNase H-like nuclease (RuvC/YqgF family)